jgi:hypothetical protein
MNDDTPQPISVELLGRLMSSHGWAQAVMIYRTEEGDEGITTAGADFRNGKIAEEIGDFFKSKVMGWKSEAGADTWDKDIALAKKEMSEGLKNEGTIIMGETLDKTRRDHITERGPKGTAKKAWARLKDKGGFKT